MVGRISLNRSPAEILAQIMGSEYVYKCEKERALDQSDASEASEHPMTFSQKSTAKFRKGYNIGPLRHIPSVYLTENDS